MIDNIIQGCTATAGEFKALQVQIKQSGLDDYKDWVEAQGAVLAEANGRGDTTKKMYKVVNFLKGKSEKPPKNLTTDGNGRLLQGAAEVADRWFRFLSKKFSATEREAQRPDMPKLPNTQGVADLTLKEIQQGVAKMKPNKVCGPDEIPIEVFQNSATCMAVLSVLLHKIWNSEEVPAEFARANFVMLYKGKGSSDDPTKYRCLAMLNHAYKALSQCLLVRIEKEMQSHLSEWQAGFRSKRGCRDNVQSHLRLGTGRTQRHVRHLY